MIEKERDCNQKIELMQGTIDKLNELNSNQRTLIVGYQINIQDLNEKILSNEKSITFYKTQSESYQSDIKELENLNFSYKNQIISFQLQSEKPKQESAEIKPQNILDQIKTFQQNEIHNSIIEDLRAANLKLENDLFSIKQNFENERLLINYQINHKISDDEFKMKKMSQEIEHLKTQEFNRTSLLSQFENDIFNARQRIHELEQLIQNENYKNLFNRVCFNETQTQNHFNHEDIIENLLTSVTVKELIKHVQYLEGIILTNTQIPRLIGVYTSTGKACGSLVFYGIRNGIYYQKGHNQTYLNDEKVAANVRLI